MIILGYGSRTWENLLIVASVIERLHPRLIIHGDHHSGGDLMFETVAKRLAIPRVRVPAAWNPDYSNPEAGPIRNSFQLRLAELIAEDEHLPLVGIGLRMRGRSSGTDDMREKCDRAVARTTMRANLCYDADGWRKVLGDASFLPSLRQIASSEERRRQMRLEPTSGG